MPRLVLLLLLVVVVNTCKGIAPSRLPPSSTSSSKQSTLVRWRGGAFGSSESSSSRDDDAETATRGNEDTNKTNKNDATVEEYVAAMKEKDCQDHSVATTRDSDSENEEAAEEENASTPADDSPSETAPPESGPDTSDSRDDSVVGVKSHTHKKSNAVGDPDGDGDSDDDDDDSLSEFSEEWEDLEELVEEFLDDVSVEPEVQVEVELVEGESVNDDEEDDDIDTGGSMASSDMASTKKGGGGVGVRLGRMNTRRRNSRKEAWKTMSSKPSQEQTRLLNAWSQFVFFPPTSPALAYLADNARLLDASSKSRLDRRTLYAGLLLEWGATESKLSSNTRKFLPAASSQALQAALSLATQPQWRQSAPRTSGIRLYQDEDNVKGCTLGMQETIAMALVSSSIAAQRSCWTWQI